MYLSCNLAYPLTQWCDANFWLQTIKREKQCTQRSIFSKIDTTPWVFLARHPAWNITRLYFLKTLAPRIIMIVSNNDVNFVQNIHLKCLFLSRLPCRGRADLVGHCSHGRRSPTPATRDHDHARFYRQPWPQQSITSSNKSFVLLLLLLRGRGRQMSNNNI